MSERLDRISRLQADAENKLDRAPPNGDAQELVAAVAAKEKELKAHDIRPWHLPLRASGVPGEDPGLGWDGQRLSVTNYHGPGDRTLLSEIPVELMRPIIDDWSRYEEALLQTLEHPER